MSVRKKKLSHSMPQTTADPTQTPSPVFFGPNLTFLGFRLASAFVNNKTVNATTDNKNATLEFIEQEG